MFLVAEEVMLEMLFTRGSERECLPRDHRRLVSPPPVSSSFTASTSSMSTSRDTTLTEDQEHAADRGSRPSSSFPAWSRTFARASLCRDGHPSQTLPSRSISKSLHLKLILKWSGSSCGNNGNSVLVPATMQHSCFRKSRNAAFVHRKPSTISLCAPMSLVY